MAHDERFHGPSRRPADAGMSAHRAALEALFAPKPPPPSVPPKRDSAKMVTVPARPLRVPDERDKFLERLLAAAGRTAVSRAVDDMRRAGVEIPEEQHSQLQVLEHADEERVREAMLVLGRLLESESPARRTVLESRLRRIEECADEASTRDLAAAVRRKLGSSLMATSARDAVRDTPRDTQRATQPVRGA